MALIRKKTMARNARLRKRKKKLKKRIKLMVESRRTMMARM